MREIKFRAWDKKRKYMFNPAPMISSWELLRDYNLVMQFTGLKDKNGKEIFEGDIVNCSFWEWNKEAKIRGKFTENGFIKWLDFKCGFVVSLGEEQFINLELGEMEFEVIGNIFEDPKLLEGIK